MWLTQMKFLMISTHNFKTLLYLRLEKRYISVRFARKLGKESSQRQERATWRVPSLLSCILQLCAQWSPRMYRFTLLKCWMHCSRKKNRTKTLQRYYGKQIEFWETKYDRGDKKASASWNYWAVRPWSNSFGRYKSCLIYFLHKSFFQFLRTWFLQRDDLRHFKGWHILRWSNIIYDLNSLTWSRVWIYEGAL